MNASLPDALRPAVDRALATAFGVTAPESITPLSGGLSGAAVYRIRVGGADYALRVTMSRDPVRDPARGFACLRTAAEAGLSPAVRYANADDGVAITDLVGQKPLFSYPGDGGPLIADIGRMIRRLHDTPPFPELTDYMAGLGRMIDQQRASGLLDPAATDELYARFADVAAAYRTDPADLVSSHNDINPGNIIYDGQRLWLIDWEAAFLADRYVDLATAANWLARGPAHEALLLEAYFGGPPTERQRARYEVMKTVNHVFVGVIFLITLAAEAPGAVLADRTLFAPPLLHMRQGLGTGAVSFARRDDRIAYGKSRLAQALHDLRTDDLARSLARAQGD